MSLMLSLGQQALVKSAQPIIVNPGMLSAGVIRLIHYRGLSGIKRVTKNQRNTLALSGVGVGFANKDFDIKREYHYRSSNSQSSRWYENQSKQGQFENSQHQHQHRNHHRSYDGGHTKLKVIGSVVLGVYVLHALPSMVLLTAGGALGAIGCRWATTSKRHDNKVNSFNNSMFPFMFQFPDTSSILKNPRQFGQLFNDPPQPHREAQIAQEKHYPPSANNLGWAIVNQLYPKVAQRAHAMQQATNQLRTQAISLLESQFKLDSNKILSLLPSSLGKINHVEDMLVEPHNEVLYQAPDHKIELELRIVLNNTSLLAKVHGRVEFNSPPPSSNVNGFEHPDFGVGEVKLTYVEVTNVKTWKSVTIQP